MRRPCSVLTCLPFALLFIAAAASSAPFQEVWQTGLPERYSVYQFVDLDGDGTVEFLTGEYENGSSERIGVRSAATGALLAQSSALYEPTSLFVSNLDGGSDYEIVFTTLDDDRLVCLRFDPTAGLVSVLWSVRPLTPAPFSLHFADLDGDGRACILVELAETPGSFQVIDSRGASRGTYVPNLPQSVSFEGLLIGDFDSDANEEVMVLHRDGPHQLLTLVESTGLVDVAGPAPGLRSVRLGASRPNPATSLTRIPYSISARGPVTLRMLDVHGREVRTLVQGELEAGSHEVVWDGRDSGGRLAPAGAYYYELSAAGERTSRRMIRLGAAR